MADRRTKYPKTLSYSKFDPGGSIDSGLSNSIDSRDRYSRVPGDATAVESVSISRENINVFVEVPGPSFLKRLCFGSEEHEKPSRKQVLFDGEYKIASVNTE